MSKTNASTGLHNPQRFTSFVTLTKHLVPAGGAMSIQGKWATFPCTKRWAEANTDGDIAAVKAAGFKTFWCRGNKMGCRVDDIGLKAKAE